MRNLKKISAVFLVIAMLFSLVAVNVYAEDPANVLNVKFKAADNSTVVTSQKGGKIVYADICVTPGEYDAIQIKFTSGAASTIDKKADIVLGDFPGAKATVVGTTITLGYGEYGEKISVTETTPLATIKMTLPATEGNVNIVDYTDTCNYTKTAESASPVTFQTITDGVINILPSFVGTKAIPSETAVEVGVGADIAATLAAKNIKATVTNGKESTDSDYKSESGYEITNWTDTSATKYDVNAPKTGTYTFTGTVTGNSEKAAQFETLTTEPVTVTVGAIDLASTDANKEFTIAPVKEYAYKQTKVVEGESHKVSAADVASDVNADATKTKTTITNNNEKIKVENAKIEWTVKSGTGTELDKDVLTSTTASNKVVLEGTVTSVADPTNYKNSAKIEMEVKVVKAEIDGGSISIGSVVDNSKLQVRVTIPANQFEAGQKVVATVYSGDTAKGSKEITIPEDTDTNKPYETTINFDDSMKTLGFTNAGIKGFSVKVTVAGTELKNGTGDDATTTVTGEVKKATSGNAGGIHKGGSTTTTYAVTVVETKNGTATVSPEKAASGATVTVKPEPAEGYKVKSVTAVKADGTNVPVDEKAYTFTMPASAVKVTVEFEEGKDEPSVDPTPAEDKFADVADDFWAAKDIYTLKDAGIIGGKSATEFDPEGDVTRAEFAKMVVGLFGYKATSDAVNFEDCKAEDWFTPYVAAGVEAGVIKGVSDTEFAPNATITREDACTILGRALNKVAQSNELKFTDADKVAEYAAPYVALLSELGYVNGYEDGSFAPANNITRAEAAKIIAGIYNAKDSTEDKADNTDTIDVAPEK